MKQINKGRIQKTMIMTAITAIQRGARLGTSESIKPCEQMKKKEKNKVGSDQNNNNSHTKNGYFWSDQDVSKCVYRDKRK